ncbi:MmoB/DmpM family protein [Granulicoccus phenolivorans]|uniref:MmoB/DmpM family protein n=1 Tax=Granulicoccus phenolivorans TaxID=266854 RepID=UPI0003FD7F7B|nr:MmoB/DmpM family protein [Granulicoccus phenolivorans]
MSTVLIAFQTNEETIPIIAAIKADNEAAKVVYEHGMVRVTAPGHLVINRDTIEILIGRPYDLQELQLNLITLSGNLAEDDDVLTLTWHE